MPTESSELDDKEFEVYAALRKWRLLLSRELDIEPYKVCQNRTLAELVRRRRNDSTWAAPNDDGVVDSDKIGEDLVDCWGIGKRKANKDNGFMFQMVTYLNSENTLLDLLKDSKNATTEFPEINIIIDILNELEAAEEDKEQIDSYSNLVDANHGEDADYNEIADISKEPLTSDSVLKYIVDRKCKLQALGARFNLTSAVEELDMEYSKVIETREQNISSRRSKHAHDLDVVDETLSRYKARADEIVSRTAAETSKFSDFMSRLKESAASHKGQILADRGGETVV
eukprot:gene23348-29561_t